MSRIGSRRAAIVLAALVLGGCAGGLTSGAASQESELARLRERLLELERQSAVAQAELEHLRGRVAELESGRLPAAAGGDPEAGDAASDRRPWSLGREEAVEPEAPVRLEEDDLEPPPRPAPASAPGTAGEGGTGQEEPRRGETGQEEPRRGETGQEEGGGEGAAPATLSLAPVSDAAQELYDRGYTLYHQGRYLDAESTFQRFLQGWPRTDLSDNALYWIGESRFGRGDYAGALSAFRECVERYPGGNKLPDALLKVGQSLERLGDTAGARSTYDELLRRFPDSAAAVSAAELRDGLR